MREKKKQFNCGRCENKKKASIVVGEEKKIFSFAAGEKNGKKNSSISADEEKSIIGEKKNICGRYEERIFFLLVQILLGKNSSSQ